jgi:hypothetical protein
MYFSGSRNSRFQYLHFIAGDCHTADEAYRIIHDQLEDRENALRLADSAALRLRAKRLRAEAALDDADLDEAGRLEAEADLMDVNAAEMAHKAAYDGADRERLFLLDLLAEIEPLRRYRDLPDHDAAEACQREEWLRKLITRAESHVATSGTVPADHFAAMRLHPDFASCILPHLEAIEQARKEGRHLLSPPPSFLKLLVASSDLAALEDTQTPMRQLKPKGKE